MKAQAAPTTLRIRDLRRDDLDAVVRIDALHTRELKADYWAGVFREFVSGSRREGRVALAAESGSDAAGFLLGEVRAFEFGSEPCGWVFAVGVDPTHARGAVGSRMLREACRRFRAVGVTRVRTMVRRTDVPVLSFFRSSGFVGGSFVQLELDLDEESA